MSQLAVKGGKLAVIDSGVGGVTVLAELKLLLPDAHIIYYADTRNCPYGGKTKKEITELTKRVVENVIEMGAEVVVIACNTMTTVAIKRLREKWQEIDFVGIQPAIKPALMNTKTGTVGVLATKATLRGDTYLDIKKRNIRQGQVVVESAGEGLVECVENNRMQTPQCKELLRKYIIPMIEKGADALVLGCTHYPFLRPQIAEIIGDKKIRIINPAPSVAGRAVEVARERGMEFRCGDGRVEYHSSGGDRALEVLSSFLDSHPIN